MPDRPDYLDQLHTDIERDPDPPEDRDEPDDPLDPPDRGAPISAFTRVGSVLVDAGLLFIGDPCYLAPDAAIRSPTSPATSWRGFIDWLNSSDLDEEGTAQHALGVVSHTGYGDGEYPVYARYSDDGLVAELRIVFIEPEKPEDAAIASLERAKDAAEARSNRYHELSPSRRHIVDTIINRIASSGETNKCK